MTRKATTIRLAPPTQKALEHISQALKRPMNQIVNEAVRDYINRRSVELEQDLAATIDELRTNRKSNQAQQDAIAAWIDAEALYGSDDPAEGQVVIGRLEHGQLIPETRADTVQSKVRQLLDAS
jgi:predicted transcriptional regulator